MPNLLQVRPYSWLHILVLQKEQTNDPCGMQSKVYAVSTE